MRLDAPFLACGADSRGFAMILESGVRLRLLVLGLTEPGQAAEQSLEHVAGAGRLRAAAFGVVAATNRRPRPAPPAGRPDWPAYARSGH